MSLLWIILRFINQYDQDGGYFEMGFDHKPSVEELDKLGYDGEHLMKGGGRKDVEYEWYTLIGVQSGIKPNDDEWEK